MLIDCGSGALGKLASDSRLPRRRRDRALALPCRPPARPDPVRLRADLRSGRPPRASATPRLIGPAGIEPYLARLGVAIGDPGLIVGAFAIEEYEPGVAVAVGESRSRLTRSSTSVRPTRSRSTAGRVGSSSAPTAATRRNWWPPPAGADVLIAEATLPEPDPSQEVHMSAAEAGRLASEAV